MTMEVPQHSFAATLANASKWSEQSSTLLRERPTQGQTGQQVRQEHPIESVKAKGAETNAYGSTLPAALYLLANQSVTQAPSGSALSPKTSACPVRQGFHIGRSRHNVGGLQNLAQASRKSERGTNRLHRNRWVTTKLGPKALLGLSCRVCVKT